VTVIILMRSIIIQYDNRMSTYLIAGYLMELRVVSKLSVLQDANHKFCYIQACRIFSLSLLLSILLNIS
jgi:hypothetical protein